MVYKTASQKILIFLFIATFTLTVISGGAYWKMWSILPTTFFMLWLAGNKGLLLIDIDVMFFDDKAYKYEPIYENWREAN